MDDVALRIRCVEIDQRVRIGPREFRDRGLLELRDLVGIRRIAMMRERRRARVVSNPRLNTPVTSRRVMCITRSCVVSPMSAGRRAVISLDGCCVCVRAPEYTSGVSFKQPSETERQLCSSGRKWYKASARLRAPGSRRSVSFQGTQGVHIMQRCVTCCSRGALILLLTLLTTGAAWAQATAQLSGHRARRKRRRAARRDRHRGKPTRAWFAPP